MATPPADRPRSSSPDPLLESYSVSEPDDVQIQDNDALHSQFKAKFGRHSVTRHATDMKLTLSPYKNEGPRDQTTLSKRILRRAGELRAAFSFSSNAQLQKVNDWKGVAVPASEWSQPLMKNKIDVFVPDETLLGDIDGKSIRCYREETEKLFTGDTPEVADIAQLDQRSSCFLLSALGAYAATPLGNRLLKETVCQYDGFVGVSLYDSALAQGNAKVLVTSKRPVDENGMDYYSFNNSTKAHWPGYVEKACHALLLERNANIKEMKRDNPGKDMSYMDNQLRFLTSDKKEEGCMLDRVDMALSMDLLPRIPTLKSPNPVFKQLSDGQNSDMNRTELSQPGSIDVIRYNIEQGIPVVLGTRDDLVGVIQASSGTPTNHAVAVIGPAVMKKKGKIIHGFLTNDPYGEAFKGGEAVPDLKDRVMGASVSAKGRQASASAHPPSIAVKSAGQSVRFHSYDDFHNHFKRAVIAHGGFVYDREHLNELATRRAQTGPSADDWELL